LVKMSIKMFIKKSIFSRCTPYTSCLI
jgi:hypothetical protein